MRVMEGIKYQKQVTVERKDFEILLTEIVKALKEEIFLIEERNHLFRNEKVLVKYVVFDNLLSKERYLLNECVKGNKSVYPFILNYLKDKLSFFSPVPGGVGPVTIAMLFSNILKVAKNYDNKR